ncbi:MAG: glycosyltransferase [Opitutaceae bacterium]|jgi:lipopolysaccharide biosynthesis glycosyltransferase
MRKALITLAVGEVPEARWSHPLFRAYARKHGFDFIVLDQWKIRRWWPLNRRKRSHFEKLQMHELLAAYDRIIYLDGDILISPDCPDLTTLVPVGHLGAIADERGPDSWRRRKELADAQAKLGKISRAEELYFNCGVLILSACHRPLLDPHNRWPAVRWPEQTGINYYARKYNVPVAYLDETYNYMPVVGGDWQEQASRLSARLVHYAGLQDRPRMEEDAPVFFRAWDLVTT